MVIKSADKGDLGTITSLAESIWYAYYPSIISTDQIQYMLDRGYSEQALTEQLASGHVFYLLEEDNQAIAYASVSEPSSGNWFLHKFYLQTGLHGRGIGSSFMRQIESMCIGITSMKLTVNRKNVQAINFYFSQGFRIDHAEDFDIGSGYVMNDFVMVKTYSAL